MRAAKHSGERTGHEPRRLAQLAWVLPLVLAAAVCSADLPQHRVRIEGSGGKTVVFEAGLGDTLEVWDPVQEPIAEHCARTVAYNRAGYLGSDPADGKRDAAAIVKELRTELQRRGIAPPYLLVGHSLGGLYMQYFARNYPSEISGLVLLDSTHWNQGLRLDKSANAPYTSMRQVTLFMSWIARRELDDSMSAGEEVHESPPAVQLPTVVLSSTRALKGQTQSAREQEDRLQDDIATDFPVARHVAVENSGHYIQQDRPDAVIDAVRKLAGCGPSPLRTARIKQIGSGP
jgi:pimeloyl-ACP methyl ester carboxylesterase